ncbi:NAD-dependent epimerase/dehydratase family protein [Caldibacillus lycopersici]|uniref:NAD-dependent epimerase/dehydratase family protein n=1 Tax=Perspicuibacillus lycopersici TaxID=1325689 RepID=A0AAE3IW95_9BACI|nr:NAD-dependent epimerase/dehydratase family protein [Perspicuibacillus lycopersici]MCU9614556.1 NAD-dependent epimerase/dehydratase family protein [Perspicuibacillus lycopersici]
MSGRPKLVITGAAGFTGRHACQYFEKNGYEVIGITRNKANDLKASKQIQCDLVNKEEVDDVIRTVCPDYVLHLAAQNHVGNSWVQPVQTVETNALSTLYLVDAIRQVNPACKMIITGSVLQFEPQNFETLPHPYSFSKTLQIMIAKAWLALYQLNIIIAKPANLIGPGESNGVCAIFAKQLVEIEKSEEEGILEVTNVHVRRDFLDVRDAVRGYGVLLERGKCGEEYEIVSGTSRSLGDIIHYLKRHTKAKFNVLTKSNTAGDIFTGNPDKLSALGWRPQIALDESLADILDYYRKIEKPV